MKIGLEIHQQLENKKLFCSCNSIIIDSSPDFIFTRRLRASASELGETDKAALYELQKGKYFIYHGYYDSNCLICIDEEPPGEINRDALDIAMQVALLLNAEPVDEIQIMRKVVIDGSNITGFQRTALIASGGYIETSEGKIKIDTVCLEEEAAKKLEDTKKYRKYNISRLGIPLIEIATSPDIISPGGAKEAASKIGMILRSVKGIKRGIGSIRQDVNVSFSGPRVEIKGFQDLQSIPKIIEFEEERQKKEGIKEPHVRKAEKNLTTSYLRPMPGSARMYPETDVPQIKITKKYLESLEAPVLIDSRVKDYEEKYCLRPELARELVKKETDFEHFITEYSNLDPNLIAKVLIEIPKELKSRLKLDTDKLLEKHFHQILAIVHAGKISSNQVTAAFVQIIKKGRLNLKDFKTVSDEEVESYVREIISKNKGISLGGIMGDLMKKYRGRIDGKKAAEIIKKLQ